MGKNKITAIIVCWKCKSGKKTLKKCLNGLDYICSFCEKMVGNSGPEIGNQSRVYVKEKIGPLTSPEKKDTFILPYQ